MGKGHLRGVCYALMHDAGEQAGHFVMSCTCNLLCAWRAALGCLRRAGDCTQPAAASSLCGLSRGTPAPAVLQPAPSCSSESAQLPSQPFPCLCCARCACSRRPAALQRPGGRQECEGRPAAAAPAGSRPAGARHRALHAAVVGVDAAAAGGAVMPGCDQARLSRFSCRDPTSHGWPAG